MEIGFYKVVFAGQKTIAYFDSVVWTLCGNEVYFCYEDFDSVGEKIEL